MSENPSTVRRGSVLTYETNADELPSEGVVAAVAAVSNADPASMDPLADAIDPDALDALFADQYDGTPRGTGSVRFSFAGYEVVVTDGSQVEILDRQA